MAKPVPAYSIQQMYDALEKSSGFLFLAARALGCSAKTVERYMYKHERLRDLVKEYRGQRVDVIEGVLFNKARAGEGWAVTLFLKTQGKDRGYSERVEHTGADGGELRLVIVESPPRSETKEEWMAQYQKELATLH
jgi:hypothetical protein